jgi:hypothetical protein
VKISNEEKRYYGSVINNYNDTFSAAYPSIMCVLEKNRRSNKIIVDYNRSAFSYTDQYVSVFEDDRISFNKPGSSQFYKQVLNPNKVLMLLHNQDGFSQKRNLFEADVVISLVKEIYQMVYKIEKALFMSSRLSLRREWG